MLFSSAFCILFIKLFLNYVQSCQYIPFSDIYHSLFHGDISQNFCPVLVKTGGSPGKLHGHNPQFFFNSFMVTLHKS